MACKFCEIDANSIDREVDQPIVECDDYYALSSIGGFIPGWTLIFPKEHQFNMSRDYRRPAFQEFVHKVAAVVSNEFGSCVYFEHGAVRQNSQTGCGVNHAHFHIVPFSKSIETLAAAHHPDYKWEMIHTSEIEGRSQGAEYLFCSDRFDKPLTGGILSVLEDSESQFFRKILASAIGLDSLYDYKKYRFEDLSTDTAVRLRKHFAFADTVAI